jgi:hypothetical protein
MRFPRGLANFQALAEAIRAALHLHVNVQIRATVTKHRAQLPAEVMASEDNAIGSFQSLLDSETAIARGYRDLWLIVRPDRRQYALLDHVIEFKHPKVAEPFHDEASALNAVESYEADTLRDGPWQP